MQPQENKISKIEIESFIIEEIETIKRRQQINWILAFPMQFSWSHQNKKKKKDVTNCELKRFLYAA